MKLPFIVYDMDGPLVEISGYSLCVHNSVRVKYGLPEVTTEQFREASDPDSKVLAKNLGMTTDEQLRDLDTVWRRGIWENHPSIRLCPGIDNVLKKYSANHPHAILTAASKTRAMHHIERFELGQYFQAIITKEDVQLPKPHENHFYVAKNIIGADFSDWVFVEDTYPNILTAKRLGIETIGVMWGYDTANKISHAKPDYVVNTVRELEETLGKIIASRNGTG